MLFRSHKYLVITTLSLFVLIGAAVVWYAFSSTATKTTNDSLVASPLVTPAELTQKYHNSLSIIIGQLEPLLSRELTAGDSAELVGLKDELLKLVVPSKAQEFHLNLVLGISKLTELLKPGRVVMAAKGAPTITSTQASLKNLLNQVP